MKKIVKWANTALLLAALTLCTFSAQAAPAIKGAITVTQPDGTKLTLRLIGDEFFHYKATADKYAVVMGDKGFYYFASATPTGLKISNIIARNAADRTTAERKQLENITPVMPGYSTEQRSKSKLLKSVANLNMKRAANTKSKQAHPPKGLIVLAQFADVKFSVNTPHTAFNNMLNATNYTENGATGSAVDYYQDNSMGKYNPEFTVVGPVTLSNSMSFYGGNDADGNDKNPRSMVTEATKLAAKEVNMADYDANNDGEIDMVFVFFAGYNEAEGAPDDTVWPHMWNASSLNQTAGGKLIGLYACTSELKGNSGVNMAGVGTFCHEFSHVLGLSDFYDTDYDNTIGDNGEFAPGLGSVSLMSSGNYNNGGVTPPYLNALERETLGWIENTTLSNENAYSMKPIHTNQGSKILTNNPGEFFILELRDNYKWDKYITKTGSGFGMVVYHVDQSQNKVGINEIAEDLWKKNKVNAYASHPCIRLYNANGTNDEFSATSFFRKGNLNNITDWSGNRLKTQVYDITVVDSETMTFKTGGSSTAIPLLEVTKTSTLAQFNIANANDIKSVTYTVNGKQLAGNTISYGSINNFNVEAIIKYNDQSTIIIETSFTR